MKLSRFFFIDIFDNKNELFDSNLEIIYEECLLKTKNRSLNELSLCDI
jgi:hypothetical protein